MPEIEIAFTWNVSRMGTTAGSMHVHLDIRLRNFFFLLHTMLMAKHITSIVIEISVKSISRKWEDGIAKIGTQTTDVIPNQICIYTTMINILYSGINKKYTNIHHIFLVYNVTCKS